MFSPFDFAPVSSNQFYGPGVSLPPKPQKRTNSLKSQKAPSPKKESPRPFPLNPISPKTKISLNGSKKRQPLFQSPKPLNKPKTTSVPLGLAQKPTLIRRVMETPVKESPIIISRSMEFEFAPVSTEIFRSKTNTPSKEALKEKNDSKRPNKTSQNKKEKKIGKESKGLPR